MKTTTYKIDYSDLGYIKAASVMSGFCKKYPNAKVDFKKNMIRVIEKDSIIQFKFVKSDGDYSLSAFVKKYFR